MELEKAFAASIRSLRQNLLWRVHQRDKPALLLKPGLVRRVQRWC